MARQGYTHAYRADANDPVRLVAQIAAVLSIGAGVIHISAAGDHTDLPVMFVGFMVVAALQIALGALLFSRPPSRLVIAGALLMMLSSIGLWVLSRTSGLPFVPGGHIEPVGFKDGVTKLFEIGSIPPLLLLASRDLARVTLPSPRLASNTLSMLGLGCLALLAPALLLGGGHVHSHAQAVAMGMHDAAGHDEAHQLAHAGTTHTHEAQGHSAQHHGKSHDTTGHDHAASHQTASVHQHSADGLAGAPSHLAHEHTTGGTHGDAPAHDHETHHGGDHQRGQHPHGNQHEGGHHGGGHHGGEHGGGEGEPAVTVSYEPQPSICVMAVCVP